MWRLASLLAAVLVLLPNGAISAPVRSRIKQFKSGPMTLTGQPKTICLIEGKWADGEPFRYEGWDACSKLTVEWVPPAKKAQTVNQVHGRDRTFVIPAGSDGFKIGNDFSRVWLFRNTDGEVEEILVSD